MVAKYRPDEVLFAIPVCPARSGEGDYKMLQGTNATVGSYLPGGPAGFDGVLTTDPGGALKTFWREPVGGPVGDCQLPRDERVLVTGRWTVGSGLPADCWL